MKCFRNDPLDIGGDISQDTKSSARTAGKVASALLLVSVAVGTDLALADRVLYAQQHHKAGRPYQQQDTALLQAKPMDGGGWDLGKGWTIGSKGGLSYVHPENDAHWFKLGGVGRLDETLFMGSTNDKGSSFPSSGNIRALDLYLDGGLGKNWAYNFSPSFSGSTASIENAYLSYMGLLQANNQVFVGKLSGNWFGLDSSNSTSWNPFLERSLGALAFYPGDGIGVMTDFWWDNGAVTLTAIQPETTYVQGARDKWMGLARATFSPLHEEGNVWHFGASGAYREVNTATASAGVVFSAPPSARARNVSKDTSVISTSLGNNGGLLGAVPMRANNYRMWNLEMARQYGPWMLEGEYTQANVHRVASTTPALGSVSFNAWNIQTRYMLTNEFHAYDVRDGNFGSVKPVGPYGAFEVAARYDYINLNDKDVRGGSEHNGTLGINWFLNQQLRFSANYIRANIRTANGVLGTNKRALNILGFRAQFRFQ